MELHSVENDVIHTVLRTEWFSIEAVSFGKNKEPYYRLTCSDSVEVLALTRDRKIVLVKQFRPAVGVTMLEMPSGFVQQGESLAQAACRELEEETGYAGDVVEYLGTYKISSSRINNDLHLFFVGNARKTSQQSTEDNRIEVVTVGIDEFVTYMTTGVCIEMAALAVYFLAQQRGKV